MENTRLVTAIGKQAVAGEQAGLSVEQMIRFLNDGLTIETLLELITWRLTERRNPTQHRVALHASPNRDWSIVNSPQVHSC